MWRMYQVLRYLRAYPYDPSLGQMESWSIQNKGAEEEKFTYYLLFKKNYREHWKSWGRKYGQRIFMGHETVSMAGMAREKERRRVIELAIQGCRTNEYLEPNNQLLKITWKGWMFSGWFMGGFFSAFMKEYSLAANIVVGLIAGLPFGLFWLWVAHTMLGL